MQALALESKSTTLINNSFLIIALVSRSGLSKGNSSASLDATQSTVGVIDFSIRDQLLTAGKTIYCLIWGGCTLAPLKLGYQFFPKMQQQCQAPSGLITTFPRRSKYSISKMHQLKSLRGISSLPGLPCWHQPPFPSSRTLVARHRPSDKWALLLWVDATVWPLQQRLSSPIKTTRATKQVRTLYSF